MLNSQDILEVQAFQQLGVLVGQIGGQVLNLRLDLGVFPETAFQKSLGQVQLCLKA